MFSTAIPKEPITFALPSPITDTATLTPTIDTNRVRSHYALRMQFLGTAAQPEIAGVDRLPGTVNYVSGATAAQWHSNVATFAGVEYRNIYPGITLRFDGAQQRLKRTYVVAPGADPTAILWRYSGQATTTIDTAGQLLVTLPVRGMPKADSQPTLLEHAPVAWQTVAGVQRPVEVNYTLNKNDTIGFRVGAYDPALPLIIDPELLYSAIIGGANKDEANAVTVDATGSVYIVGETSSSSFPATTGTYSQSSDAFVMRLNPQGTAILYSTYLNGTASDEANAIAVDASGQAFVTGSTNSTNFGTTPDAFQRTDGGYSQLDLFLTKLDPTGKVLYSTLFGGGPSEIGYSIALAPNGRIIVVGKGGYSSNLKTPSIPITSQAIQPLAGRGVDILVAVFDLAATPHLRYSTLFGGIGEDLAYDVAVDARGHIYLTGVTKSTNFRVTTGAFDTTPQTEASYFQDAFVAKINPYDSSTGQLVYSTFLGGGSADVGYAIAVTPQGEAIVGGNTNSGRTGSSATALFPVTAGAFQVTPVRASDGGVDEGFVAKLTSNGQGLVFGTYFGSNGKDEIRDIVIHPHGAVSMTGLSSRTLPPYNAGNFPQGSAYTDALIATLTADGRAVELAGVIGGTGNDYGYGIALGTDDTLYIVGATNSATSFPATPGAIRQIGSNNDVFVTAIKGPVLPNDQQRCGCSGHLVAPHNQTDFPVNTRTGNFWTTTTDLAVQTPGPALVWQRTYASQAITETATTLGYGWQSSYSARLILPSMPTGEPQTLIVFDSRNNRLRFTDRGNGIYQAWAGVYSTLTRSNGAYTYTLRDQTQYVFRETDGVLLRVRNPQGQTVQLGYDSANRLTNLTDAQDPSRLLTLTYNTTGQIASVSDGIRTVSYTYDTSGDLINVYDVMQRRTTYRYSGHRLTSIENALDQVVERIHYDTSVVPARVDQQTLLDGQSIKFTYTPTMTTILTTGSDGVQTVQQDFYTRRNILAGTAINGQAVLASRFDEGFSPIVVRDGNDQPTISIYTPNGLPTTSTNALGSRSTAAYDSRNNLTSTIDALGITTRYRYNQFNQVISTTVGLSPANLIGETTLYTYTSDLRPGASLLQAQRSPVGVVTRYAYNLRGQVQSTTVGYGTPLAQVTTLEYDSLGRVEWQVMGVNTALERRDRTVYHPDNTIAQTIRNYQDGVFDSSSPDTDIVTTYGYDALGRPAWTRNVLGRYDVTRYNVQGRVDWMAKNYVQSSWSGNPLPSQPPMFNQTWPDRNIVTAYAYDSLGRTMLMTETGLLTGNFDAATRHWTTITNRVTRTKYDALSRPVAVSVFNPAATNDTDTNTPPTTVSLPFTVSHRVFVPLALHVSDGERFQSLTYYDGAGNITGTRDWIGRWTTTQYDAASRPITVTVNLNGSGNPANSAVDANIITVNQYDAGGRLVATISPYINGVFTAAEPDADRFTRYTYDTLGRVTRTMAVAVDSSSSPEHNRITETAYAPITGLIQASRDVGGRWTSYGYDALGRVITTTQNCVSYSGVSVASGCASFDAFQPDRNQVTRVAYDSLGQMTDVTDPLEIVSHTTFDRLGRPIVQVQNAVSGVLANADTNVTTLTQYDGLGRVLSVTDPVAATTTSGYDALGRITTVTDAAGRTTTFGYDGAGVQRWSRRTDGRLDVAAYDWLGRQTSSIANYQDGQVSETDLSDQDVTTSFAYDDVGRLVYQLNALDWGRGFTYDATDRLISVAEDIGLCTWAMCQAVTTYTYDRMGNRVALTMPDGARRTWTYDAADQIRTQADALGRTTSWNYTPAGQVANQIDPRGSAFTIDYQYNALGQPTTLIPTSILRYNVIAIFLSFIED